MGKVNEYSLDLLENYGEDVDCYYIQFLEVAFFLKVAASNEMAIAFIKRKLPVLAESEISFLISEIVGAYQDTL